MNIVVVGDGKVGKAITRLLAEEGHDVVIIDNRERVLESASNTLDVMTLFGNGLDHDTQLEAGVEHADLLIAATSADEINILCCLIAKKLGAKNTIARVRNPQYADQLVFLREDLGLSLSINPEQAAAGEISRLLRYPAALKVDLFARGRLEMVELSIAGNSPINGLQLIDLYRKIGVRTLVCAVRRDGKLFIPDGSFILAEHDHITVSANAEDMERFWNVCSPGRAKIKNVMIVGGGHIAHYLSRLLLSSGIDVKIVEKNPERCRELCDWLPKAMIIEGNGTEHQLLIEEGLDEMGGFVALTGVDEENIILSLYANSRKVNKVISKVNDTELLSLVEGVGLDSFVSPKDLTAAQIVSYVRAMQNTMGSSVETLYKIAGGLAEALEFSVRAGSLVIGKKLKNLNIKPGILVAGIMRGRSAFVPGGNDSIEAGDRVVLVATASMLDELDDILR